MHSSAWKTWAAVAVVLVVVVVGLVFIAPSDHGQHGAHVHPAMVEHIEGSELSRVTLTEKAAERIGAETVPVREEVVERWRVIRGEVVSIGDDVYETSADSTGGMTQPAPSTGTVQVASTGPIWDWGGSLDELGPLATQERFPVVRVSRLGPASAFVKFTPSVA